MLPRHRCRDRRGHHPWRYLGDHLPHWSVVWTDDLPPGRWGLTVHREQKIRLSTQMNQHERRSTLTHELGHVLRGPQSVCRRIAEEALVDRQAARLLLPSVRRVGQALIWARADHDLAAHELWVDDQLLNVRLSTLAPRERAWLDEQYDTIFI